MGKVWYLHHMPKDEAEMKVWPDDDVTITMRTTTAY